MQKEIITNRSLDWKTILKWMDKLDVDVLYHECMDNGEYFRAKGSDIEVNLLEQAIEEGTDFYIEEYLWGRIKKYVCPFYDKCLEKCSSRYDVHFNGCPWGYEKPYDGGFQLTELEEGYTMEFDPSKEEEIE